MTRPIEPAPRPTRFGLIKMRVKWFFSFTLVQMALVFGALAFIGAVGMKFGKPRYLAWRNDQFLKQAEVYYEEGDATNTYFLVRKILLNDRGHAGAMRLAIRIIEDRDASGAQEYYVRLAAVEKDRALEHLMKAALIAHEEGDDAFAWRQIEKAFEEGQGHYDFHKLALAVSWNIDGEYDAARYHVAQLRKLRPGDPLLAIDERLVELGSPDAAEYRIARNALLDQQDHPTKGTEIKRALLRAAVNRGFRRESVRAAEVLAKVPDLPFADRILILGVRGRLDPENFESYLEETKQAALGDPQNVREVGKFLLRVHRFEEALAWVDSLDEQMRASVPIQVMRAFALLNLAAWDEILATLPSQQWEILDFQRFHILSRAWRERGDIVEWNDTWQLALITAKRHPDSLKQLFDSARSWGWGRQAAEVLWEVAETFPRQDWATEVLENYLRVQRDSFGLARLYALRTQDQPDNTTYQIEALRLNLLRLEELNRSHVEIIRLHEWDPSDPIRNWLLAFSHFRQGEFNEAFARASALDPLFLRKPRYAPAWIAILRAVGKDEEATLAEQALTERDALLPEEVLLAAWTPPETDDDPRPDYQRYLDRAIAQRKQGQLLESQDAWHLAVLASRNDDVVLRKLLRHTEEAAWDRERAELLQRLASRFPREESYHDKLAEHYRERGQTRQLRRVLADKYERFPDDPALRKELAFLSLLQNTELARAHVLANSLREYNPNDAEVDRLYALSLYRQGRHAEALAVLEASNPEDANLPQHKLFRGAVLLALERTADAWQAAQGIDPSRLAPDERPLLREIQEAAAQDGLSSL